MNVKITKIKLFSWYTFFMAAPFLLIGGVNISILLFALLFYGYNQKINTLRVKTFPQVMVGLFALAAVISVIFIESSSGVSLRRSLAVLPNFIYWSILIIFLINIRNEIDLNRVSKSLFIGLIVIAIVYFFVPNVPYIINGSSPNSFAFITICFTAPAAVYLRRRYSLGYAILFSLVVMLLLYFQGRRAGLVLVLLSSFGAIFVTKVKTKVLFGILFLGVISFNILMLPPVQKSLIQLNPRIFGLVYKTEEVFTEDRSYLVRRLMVEKAILISKEHPFTGIGLSNFTNYDVSFIGDFEGSEYVIRKSSRNDWSAHNSYAALLAEGGYLLLTPFVMLLLYNLFHFATRYNRRGQLENAFYWALIGMIIHIYFISAILNVFAWFLIGIVSALSVLNKQKVRRG